MREADTLAGAGGRQEATPVARTTLRREAPVAMAWLALAGLAGCGGPSGETTGEPGPIVVDAVELHRLPPSDAVAEVEDLEVLPDGTVWVLNSVEPRFVEFGPDGGRLAAYGRNGGGPREFRAPAGFVVGGLDGEAWVLERARHALVRIAGPDAPPAERPLPREAIPPGSVLQGMSLFSRTIRTARLGDEVILPRRSGTGEISAPTFWTTIWGAELVAFDTASGSVRTVVSLPEALGDLGARFEELSGGEVPFPFWFRLWAACPDGVWLYDFTRDQLRGFTAGGVELEPVPVRPPFTEVTPEEFGRAVFDLAAAEVAGEVTSGVGEMTAADSARIMDRIASRVDRSPSQLAGVLPPYVDFRCADDGAMWLRPLDLERGGLRGGPRWVRIGPEGETREVRFPERFDPFRFTAGRVWGVARDRLDVASVAWVEAPSAH